MNYSIFHETMADMTYVQIEQAAKEDALLLFPIAVIEEHGPHLCLGTDVYISHSICMDIKNQLEKKNINTLIVPPFYWGINLLTSAFSGSFTSQEETMKNCLIDIIKCLDNWGFKKVVAISGHNDIPHSKVILDVAKECTKQHDINMSVPLPDDVINLYGYTGQEDYILGIKSSFEMDNNLQMDIHAGSLETSQMILKFEGLVNKEIAQNLKPTNIAPHNMKDLFTGGEVSKKLIPDGYCGDPSTIDIELAKRFQQSIVDDITESIVEKYYKEY